MKPREEQSALAQLKTIRKALDALEDGLLLEVFARDDQDTSVAVPFANPQADPVHKATFRACRRLENAAQAMTDSWNFARWIIGHQELPDPEPTHECEACGKPVAGQMRDGFCGACAVSSTRYRKQNPQSTREDFIAYRREHHVQLVSSD